MSTVQVVEIDVDEDDLAELDRLAARFGGDRSAFLGEAILVMSQRQTAEESLARERRPP